MIFYVMIMAMIGTFLKRLNEPFPDRNTPRENLSDTVLVGLCIAGFLYYFKPFGLHRVPDDLWWMALSFGAVSVVCSLSFDLLLQRVLRIQTDLPSWTLWKWLLMCAATVCWIAIGNFMLLMTIVPNAPFKLSLFLAMLKNTMVVATIPVLVSGLLIQVRAAKKNLLVAKSIDSSLSTLNESTSSDLASLSTVVEFELSAQESLPIEVSRIRYIEAMQNYLAVHYVQLDSDDTPQVKKAVIRGTVQGSQAMLAMTPVVRCHRSFLVNANSVVSVEGNAQGLKLSLAGLPDVQVPVSRRYIASLRALL